MWTRQLQPRRKGWRRISRTFSTTAPGRLTKLASQVDFLFLLLQPRRLPGAGLQHGVQRGEPAVRVQGGHAVEQQVGHQQKSDS